MPLTRLLADVPSDGGEQVEAGLFAEPWAQPTPSELSAAQAYCGSCSRGQGRRTRRGLGRILQAMFATIDFRYVN